MQYKYEYDIVETKDEFISLLYTNYDVKWTTACRRWYDLDKLFPKKIVVYTNKEFVEKVKEVKNTTLIFDETKEVFIKEPKHEVFESAKYLRDEMIQPSCLKMLELKDMKKFGYKITRPFLSRYGFNNDEINWLDEKGYLEETK